VSRFVELLKRKVVVCDGAMGSMLHQSLPHQACLDAVNLERPDLVLAIHLRYIAAGAEVIETNSFGANRIRLREHGLEERLAEINGRAVKLAREAREIAGREVFVAGSMGPIGGPPPQEPDLRAGYREVFREQAQALEDRGVDLFVLETVPTWDELELAVEAVRSVTSLPIIAQITFPPGADPVGAAHHLQRLRERGATVVGANCGVGPADMLETLARVGALSGDAYVSAQPNAGVPSRAAGRYIYPASSPEYFSNFAVEAARLGVRLIGGCCGTTPEHIRAVAEATAHLAPGPAESVAVAAPVVPEVRPVVADRPSPLLQKMLDGGFALSVQVDPPKGPNPDHVMEAVQEFKKAGTIDCVDINSNPMARLHMDALWMALRIEALGMPTIPHLTPRDSSLMGIEGQLLGAWHMGIRNLLIITGDPSQVGDYAGSRDVYQTDSVGLVKVLADLNRGLDCAGQTIGTPTGFTLGVAVNPGAEDLELEVERFRQKVKNGARFAMTQVFFEWAPWERFLQALGGPPPIPVMAAIWPLTSLKLAERLHNEVPGIVVPEAVREMLRRAGKDARASGFALARELLQEARRRVQGAYVIAPFKQPVAALEVLA
jgi:homocysteine S-methyltransferase